MTKSCKTTIASLTATLAGAIAIYSSWWVGGNGSRACRIVDALGTVLPTVNRAPADYTWVDRMVEPLLGCLMSALMFIEVFAFPIGVLIYCGGGIALAMSVVATLRAIHMEESPPIPQ